MTKPEERDLNGIGGWLLLFLAGQVVGAALTLGRIGDPVTQMSLDRPPLVVVLSRLLRVAGIIAGLILLFKRHRLTPAYWCAFIIVGFALIWIEAGLSFALFLDAIPRVIWFIYWGISERVHATFGSVGFDAVGKHSATDVLRDRRRRRTIR